ncbi:hypothetical protein MBM_09327 [Drepanopeziza brunnea f. sp. 'multigermtubi' MB_m1]|uniref:Uncharacterized protein n=1 Tax=Marssonina brunnea f. sp. multigermtubi (strain MB_m1) TaxID=1072389 RepID=K1WHV8_MARBU|nr:uncharacterized protein MBM_09327 [Drepanopeziza brunnea f. sp. 'multigermtubi' MB_m1]EKD12461.1 hypothetical protein MBM_09327 [Drepanopeziza brunnea f. sp. 'multigermtubi' MB_m1]
MPAPGEVAQPAGQPGYPAIQLAIHPSTQPAPDEEIRTRTNTADIDNPTTRQPDLLLCNLDPDNLIVGVNKSVTPDLSAADTETLPVIWPLLYSTGRLHYSVFTSARARIILSRPWPLRSGYMTKPATGLYPVMRAHFPNLIGEILGFMTTTMTTTTTTITTTITTTTTTTAIITDDHESTRTKPSAWLINLLLTPPLMITCRSLCNGRDRALSYAEITALRLTTYEVKLGPTLIHGKDDNGVSESNISFAYSLVPRPPRGPSSGRCLNMFRLILLAAAGRATPRPRPELPRPPPIPPLTSSYPCLPSTTVQVKVVVCHASSPGSHQKSQSHMVVLALDLPLPPSTALGGVLETRDCDKIQRRHTKEEMQMRYKDETPKRDAEMWCPRDRGNPRRRGCS